MIGKIYIQIQIMFYKWLIIINRNFGNLIFTFRRILAVENIRPKLTKIKFFKAKEGF